MNQILTQIRPEMICCGVSHARGYCDNAHKGYRNKMAESEVTKRTKLLE